MLPFSPEKHSFSKVGPPGIAKLVYFTRSLNSFGFMGAATILNRFCKPTSYNWRAPPCTLWQTKGERAPYLQMMFVFQMVTFHCSATKSLKRKPDWKVMINDQISVWYDLLASFYSISSHKTLDSWSHRLSIPSIATHGNFQESLSCSSTYNWINIELVGGLEHEFYFSIYFEFHHPNWLSYFSEG